MRIAVVIIAAMCVWPLPADAQQSRAAAKPSSSSGMVKKEISKTNAPARSSNIQQKRHEMKKALIGRLPR